MKNIIFAFLMLFVFNSCNSDDSFLGDALNDPFSENKNNINNKESFNITIKGVVVDGYIKGATICLDENKDNRCYYDLATTTSNEKGEFTLIFKAKKNTSHTLLVVDGIDTAINKRINGTYKRIVQVVDDEKRAVQYLNITPLTTLVANIYNKQIKENPNYDLSSATKVVATSLEIEVKTVSENPLKSKVLFEKTQQVVQTVSILKSVIQQDDTSSNAKQAFDFVMDKLASSISNNNHKGGLDVTKLANTLSESKYDGKAIKISHDVLTLTKTNMENIRAKVVQSTNSNLEEVQKITQAETSKVVSIVESSSRPTASSPSVVITPTIAHSLILSSNTLTLTEGETSSYTINLSHKPSSNVSVAIASLNTAVATVSQSTLTFTATNWGTTQTITIAGVQDDDLANGNAIITNTASNGGYDSIVVNMTATITDDDVGISGNPQASISAYYPYSFTPTINNRGSGSLTFSIDNKPSWATFNNSTGLLNGSPLPTDIGNYQNIIISVSNGANEVNLTTFNIEVKPAINIANVYGIATQPADTGYYGAPSLAIDGDYSTANHTENEAEAKWIQVELPTNSTIASGKFYHGSGNLKRLVGAKLYLLDTPYNGVRSSLVGEDILYTFGAKTVQEWVNTANISGKYLLISDSSSYLHLKEIEIYGAIPLSPVFDDNQSSYKVKKTTSINTVIISKKATDYQNDTITYSINENAPFSINAQGDISVSGVLDKPSYFLEINASDGINFSIIDVIIDIIIDDIPPELSNISEIKTFVKNTKITPFSFTSTKGYIESCAITIGTIPVGLEFNSSTCEISGTPTEAKSSTTYTITATNASGSHSATVVMVINDVAPNIANISQDKNFIGNIKISDVDFINTGGVIESCSINPSLPSGLSLNTNCQISGTPDDIIVAQNTYNVTAKNITGESIATVKISVIKNTGLLIYGEPKTSIALYDKYEFTPGIVNTENGTLTFSIENKPSWATFNDSTGLLQGLTSLTSDIGSYTNIIISVSDGTVTTALIPFSINITSAIDIAHKYGTASQEGGDTGGYAQPASKMIDNDDSTANHTKSGGAWVQVELPKSTTISKIVIQNSNGSNLQRLKDAKVYISDKPYLDGLNDSDIIGTLAETGNEQIFEFATPKQGSYISIKGDSYFHFKKIEAYGTFPNIPVFDSKANTYYAKVSSPIGIEIASLRARNIRGGGIINYALSDNSIFSIDNNGSLKAKIKLGYSRHTFNVIARNDTHQITKSITIVFNSDGELEDIAHKYGIATQGSDNSYAPYLPANNMIDNDINTRNMTADNTIMQVEIPKGTKISKLVITTGFAHWMSGKKIYLTMQEFNGTIPTQDEVGTMAWSQEPQEFNFANPRDAQYVMIYSGHTVSSIEVYGTIPIIPYIVKSDFATTIDKWNGVTKAILQSKMKDYQNLDINYNIEENVPFRVDSDGYVYVDGVLEAKTYIFNVKGDNGRGHLLQEIKVVVLGTGLVNAKFRTNDSTPALTGYLPNTYSSGDNVKVIIDGNEYTETANIDGNWSIANNVISKLAISNHNISVQINSGESVVYEDYFEVFHSRRHYKDMNINANTISDIDIQITSSISAPLNQTQRAKATDVRLDKANGQTILVNNSYHTLESLIGVYIDDSNKKQFVKLIFDQNIEPYSKSVLNYSNSKNISIFHTAGLYDLEIYFMNKNNFNCTATTATSLTYCRPTTRLETPYSTHSPFKKYGYTALSEQQVYSRVTATWNHLYNRLDGLKSIDAYIKREDYKGMSFSAGGSQSSDSYATGYEKENFFFNSFMSVFSPINSTRYYSIRYKYGAEGYAGGSSSPSLTGEKSPNNWASAWESYLRVQETSGSIRGATYETIGHEAMHTHGMSHFSGLTYGWPNYASYKFIPKYYPQGIAPIIKAPKYVFDTKVLSQNSLEIDIYKTTDATKSKIKFDLLSSTGINEDDFIYESISANKMKLTFNDKIFPRFFIRAYGEDSDEFTSILIHQEMMLQGKIGEEHPKKYYLFSHQNWQKMASLVGYTIGVSEAAQACKLLLGNSLAKVGHKSDADKIQSNYRSTLDDSTWTTSKKFHARGSDDEYKVYDYTQNPYTENNITNAPITDTSIGLMCVAPTDIVLSAPYVAIDIPLNVYYSFTPHINKAHVKFAIQNKPDWLSFNESNGTLEGTPTQKNDDINITISAIYKDKTVFLEPLNIHAGATNIARFGKATAVVGGYYYSDPAQIIDGDYSTTNHTPNGTDNDWVQVELMDDSKIERVTLFNAPNGQNRLINAKLYLLDSPYDGNPSSLDGKIALHTYNANSVQLWANNKNIEGKYVLIKGQGGANKYITLRELEVYGTFPDKPFVIESDFYVDINTVSHGVGDTILQVQIRDIYNSSIAYSIVSDESVPFSVDSSGNISPNGTLEAKTYTFKIKGTSDKGYVEQEVNIYGDVNIAHLHGTATQGAGTQYYDDPQRAIDGNYSTANHTPSGSNTNWLQVELLDGSTISRVKVFNTNGNQVRLIDAKLYLLTSPYNGNPSSLDGESVLYTYSADSLQVWQNTTNIVGKKYVLIKGAANWLHMKEIEVYGTSPDEP